MEFLKRMEKSLRANFPEISLKELRSRMNVVKDMLFIEKKKNEIFKEETRNFVK